MKRFLEEAKRMIRINPVSANGNEEIANYVAALMQDRGLKTQIQHVTHSNEAISKRQFNVIGILGDPLSDRKIRKGLLFSSHLDTVSPGITENWTETGGDPFAATLKEGKLFGLGTADSKLDFLCKLHAVQKYRERKLENPVYLVGTCGEERGMFGAKYLIKSLIINPKYVFVGEPTGLKVVYSNKSLHIYKVSVGYQLVERDARGFNRKIILHSFGKSAHSSYPHLGMNAVLAAIDFLQRAMEQGFDIRFTHLNGGDTVNKVPDRSIVEFYLTSHQFEDFKRFFRDFIKSEGRDRAFRVELGGVGDTGVRFLPDTIFSCITDSVNFFKNLSSQIVKPKDESFDLPSSTINFGQLEQRKGLIEMYFDMKLLPNLSVDELEKQIQRGIQIASARYPSLNVAVVRERMNPSLTLPLEDDLIKISKQALELAGIKPEFIRKAASTEAAQFFHAGYPTVGFGPGISQGNSHSPNEHNLLDHIEKAILFYEKLIEKVCV